MLVQCLNACMRTTIPTTMTWWGQDGRPLRSPPSVSWVSQGEFSLVNVVLILSILVPLISICSGLVSDFTKNKYGMPRSYCLVLVAVMFFSSQVATGSINDITHLWIASALLGLGYGSAFSLLPTVCIEWFGMRKCGFLPLFFKYWMLSYQRTSPRTWVISFCHLSWLVTSSLFYLGGTLMRTAILHPTMLYWTLLSIYIPLLDVC